MKNLQPEQLKNYFNPGQELEMQDQIKEYFKTPHVPGFYLCCIMQAGLNATYHVAFSIEFPDSGKPFIIEVLIEDKEKISYKNFLLKANAKTEEPWNNPNRLIALAMHNQKKRDCMKKFMELHSFFVKESRSFVDLNELENILYYPVAYLKFMYYSYKR